jgi:prolyl oligopeptidase
MLSNSILQLRGDIKTILRPRGYRSTLTGYTTVGHCAEVRASENLNRGVAMPVGFRFAMVFTFTALIGLQFLSCQSGPRREGTNIGANVGVETSGVKLPASTGHNLESDSMQFLDLEDVESPKALAWVREQNKFTKDRYGSDADYNETRQEILSILEAKDRIPSISIREKEAKTGKQLWVRHFLQGQDAKGVNHVRGIVREQSLADFKAKKENWRTIFDVDAVAKKDKRNWVFEGLDCAPQNSSRCLLMLSDGGADAVWTREFDIDRGVFVKGGFEIPMGKVSSAWRDDDSLWVSYIDRPEAASRAGYGLEVRLVERGHALASAAVVYRGDAASNYSAGYTIRSESLSVDLIQEGISFFEAKYFARMADGMNRRLPLPLGVELHGLYHSSLLFSVRKPDRVKTVDGDRALAPDVLYAISAERWLADGHGADRLPPVETVFAPLEKQTIGGVSVTKGRLWLSYLDDVVGKVREIKRSDSGYWSLGEEILPGRVGNLTMGFADYRIGEATMFYSDFTTPSQMYLISDRTELLRETPSRFDNAGVQVQRHEAKSKDGTKVPYFLVLPSKRKAAPPYPVLISAYGGFEVPMVPNYLGATGKVWVEKGGAFVLACLRGGGEFGSKWHQAALKEKRQNAFDDLFAVAEDLIQKRLTVPQKLGVRGGSNGGLLAGVALTQRPGLFSAVLSQVPLLDMLRYHKLLAGASWKAEYGDPDQTADREWLLKYSPFQALKPGAQYPEALFTTSTRDDRVHPGHARRMVAKMKALGIPVLYFENTDGGHSGAAEMKSRATLQAMEYRYLWSKVGSPVGGE